MARAAAALKTRQSERRRAPLKWTSTRRLCLSLETPLFARTEPPLSVALTLCLISSGLGSCRERATCREKPILIGWSSNKNAHNQETKQCRAREDGLRRNESDWSERYEHGLRPKQCTSQMASKSHAVPLGVLILTTAVTWTSLRAKKIYYGEFTVIFSHIFYKKKKK